MNEQFQNAFKEEAYELLNQLENSLLELETNPDDQEHISSVFRAVHTIKGSAGMFGFDEISTFAHTMETYMDSLRQGEIQAEKELIDLLLSSKDLFLEMLNPENMDKVQRDKQSKKLLSDMGDTVKRLKAELAAEEDPEGSEKEEGKEETAKEKKETESGEKQGFEYQNEVTYRIKFKPAKDFFYHGSKPLKLLEELRKIGECTVVPYTDAIPKLSELSPEDTYLEWDIICTTKKTEEGVRGLFEFVIEQAEISIQKIDEIDAFAGEEESYRRLGEILVDRGLVNEDNIKKALQSQHKIGEMLVENNIITQAQLDSALEEQKHVRKVRESKTFETSTSSIRVQAEKLDKLVDLVGELVTVQARLTQLTKENQHGDLENTAEQIQRLTGELRDNAMSIRMLPIGTTFNRFRRLVRDLSGEQGKEVEMVTVGGETELDKTVIERLNDPLIHLIRNSIDHGLEKPSVRKQNGKPAQGTIKLSASHSGASVLITIEDDGAGFSAEKIRKRAESRNLISPNADVPETELLNMVFEPGFSTAEKVTNVSGRGVGMDVVKSEIESLGGSVWIGNSKECGSVTTLQIPLTLAIIEGLLTRIGNEHFVIPLSSVDECVELKREDREKQEGRNIINLRGSVLPYFRLREIFELGGELPEIEQIVVTDSSSNKGVGIVVDEVIGSIQTVIKGLGRLYKGVKGVSGATILGDGTIALILDIHKLTEMSGEMLME